MSDFDLAPSPALDFLHVVLVEPEDNINIGSVARAMRNLGFQNLHLVRPKSFNRERAQISARHAGILLDNLKIHDDLASALERMQDVVGFSSLHSDRRPAHQMLADWESALRARPLVHTALLFGPEDTGLRLEHIDHCRTLVRIPSSADYHSYNLAQAVLLVLFELRRIDWTRNTSENQPAPDWNLYYQLDRLLEEVMLKSEFIREGSPEPIPSLVKNMFRRLSPDDREMRVLLALFSRLSSALSRAGKSN